MENKIKNVIACVGFAICAFSSNAAFQPGQTQLGHIKSTYPVVTQECDNVFMEWTRTNNYVKAETDPMFNSWLSTYNWGQYLKGISLNGTPQTPNIDKVVELTGISTNGHRHVMSDITDLEFPESGQSNKIEKITLNGSEEFVAVDEATKTVNITNVVTKPELDHRLSEKLDVTNGVAFSDLKVYPTDIVMGSTHLILTHESMSIGNTSWVEYKQDGITYNDDSYEFSNEQNGIARLKDIPVVPTIVTNGIDVAVTPGNKINIEIPDVPIKSVTTNGTEFSVREGVVTIPLDEYVRLKDLQEGITFDNLSATNLIINGKQVSVEGHKHVVEDITNFVPVTISTISTNGVAITPDESRNVEISIPAPLAGLWEIPGAEAASNTAIQKIDAAQNMNEVKAALKEFLESFKKPTP